PLLTRQARRPILGTKRAPGKAQKSAKPWNINRAGRSSRIRPSGKDNDSPANGHLLEFLNCVL
ncbi:MAG TPA: hypothetical protein VNO32_60680, partial [Candidatus Acidoferrum sp.]|nr:hypothetical protein [Candidatus Acidoferrum sp.]